MAAEGKLWPQMHFYEEKRLCTADLQPAASVFHMLDNLEDTAKVRVGPRIIFLLSFEDEVNLQLRML